MTVHQFVSSEPSTAWRGSRTAVPYGGKAGELPVKATDRKRQALELRRAGFGFVAIAEKLGYRSVSGAYGAVMRGLKETLREPADDLRKMELERLDRAQVAIWQAVQRGNTAAIDRLIRIMERRAKLLGLDAPLRYERMSDGEVLGYLLGDGAGNDAGAAPADAGGGAGGSGEGGAGPEPENTLAECIEALADVAE